MSRFYTLPLVFGAGISVSMHLDSGRHVIRVGVESLLELSEGHIVWHSKDGGPRSLRCELLTKTNINRFLALSIEYK